MAMKSEQEIREAIAAILAVDEDSDVSAYAIFALEWVLGDLRATAKLKEIWLTPYRDGRSE